jgi:hypothetical protein
LSEQLERIASQVEAAAKVSVKMAAAAEILPTSAVLLRMAMRRKELPQPGLISGCWLAREYVDLASFALRVPKYQRFYEWSALFGDADSAVIQLLCDLRDTIGDDKQPFHVLGSVVLAWRTAGRGENGPLHADVVDGQQRSTTLVIIYAVLAACLREVRVAKLRSALWPCVVASRPEFMLAAGVPRGTAAGSQPRRGGDARAGRAAAEGGAS